MTHEEVGEREIVEKYVRDELSAEDRRAFQEHFFGCDACFDEVQTLERFAGGVRDAAERGVIGGELGGGVPPRLAPRWLWSAFGLASAATIVLAVFAGWLALDQVPALRRAVKEERQIRERAEAQARAAASAARAVRDSRPQVPGNIQGNIPLIVMQATRDVAAPANAVALPADAAQIVLWVETEAPGPTFRLEVRTADRPFDQLRTGRLVHVIDGLRKNTYGALTVSLPASGLASGTYLVRLYSTRDSQSQAAGEYTLEIQR